MKEKLLRQVILMSAMVIMTVLLAFIVAGAIIFTVHNPEVSVLLVFSLWVLWFGWNEFKCFRMSAHCM